MAAAGAWICGRAAPPPRGRNTGARGDMSARRSARPAALRESRRRFARATARCSRCWSRGAAGRRSTTRRASRQRDRAPVRQRLDLRPRLPRSGNNTCAEVVVPANGYLSPFGNDWECERLYRKVDGACVAVVIPAHAFAEDGSYGRGWRCEQGYRERERHGVHRGEHPGQRVRGGLVVRPRLAVRARLSRTDGRLRRDLVPANALLDATARAGSATAASCKAAAHAPESRFRRTATWTPRVRTGAASADSRTTAALARR